MHTFNIIKKKVPKSAAHVVCTMSTVAGLSAYSGGLWSCEYNDIDNIRMKDRPLLYCKGMTDSPRRRPNILLFHVLYHRQAVLMSDCQMGYVLVHFQRRRKHFLNFIWFPVSRRFPSKQLRDQSNVSQRSSQRFSIASNHGPAVALTMLNEDAKYIWWCCKLFPAAKNNSCTPGRVVHVFGYCSKRQMFTEHVPRDNGSCQAHDTEEAGYLRYPTAYKDA